MMRDKRQKIFLALKLLGLFAVVALCILVGVGFYRAASSSVADGLTCGRVPVLLDRFTDNHYALKEINKEVRDHAVEQLINNLDPSKSLLYESDVNWIRPVLGDLFTNMQSAKCALTKPVYDLLVARAQENETIVKDLLGDGYRPDPNAVLYANAKKRPYVKTQAEKRALLKNIVQFQIENDLLAKIGLEEAKKGQLHQYELLTKRITEKDPGKLITSAVESFASALDPHTGYLSPDNFAEIQIYTQLSLEGIGAVLVTDNGFTVIEEMMPGGSAERSGVLKPKDKIIAVAQENEKPVNIIDMELREVVKLIRGKKGTYVTLTVMRQEDKTSRFNVTVMRDKINMTDQEAKITYETRSAGGKQYRFGVIELPSFYGDEERKKSCYNDIKRLLGEARKQGVDGIVLDLSRNTGGFLNEAVNIVGLFIGKGGVVATRDSDGKEVILAVGEASPGMENDGRKVMRLPSPPFGEIYTGPLVVLTSRLSASASEIVAGALKDYRRAVIVGPDHTFGKGSVQHLVPLPRGLGGMKVTVAMYFLPGGKSTQKIGVSSDVQLPNRFAAEDFGEVTLDYSLPSQSITPFIGSGASKNTAGWTVLEQSLLTELSSRSQRRVAQDDKFAELIRKNKEAAGRKGFIRIADLREEKENGRWTTTSEFKKKDKEQNVPFVNESINVLMDLVLLRRV